MTHHQFKFGDRVRHLTTDEEYIVWGMVASDPLANDYELGAVEVIGKDYFGRPKVIEFSTGCLQHLHHPDTVRLNFIERAIPISGRLKREMNIGWQLQNEDNDPTMPKLLLRDAIDAAMQEQAAEAKE